MRRLRWVIAVAGTAVVALGSILTILVVRTDSDTDSAASTSDRAAIQQWWATAREPIEELQAAIDDSEDALQRIDKPAMTAACRHIHDSAAVGLQTSMPAPDAELTAELAAAVEDFHSAAHMCLAVVEGSLNSYEGEFVSTLEQAEKHLEAALDLVQENLLAA